MKKKITLFLLSVIFHFTLFAQKTDYANVIFSSKIYEYKKTEPRTNELGIDQSLIEDIVDLLGDSLYSEKEKKEIVNKAWLAFYKPKMFDYVYKDFAVKTITSWGKTNARGELVLEPNPYLTEWTMHDDEFPYFQLALSKILDHYHLIGYGDDAEGVKSTFSELLITKNIRFQNPSDEDWAFSYLETANSVLEKKGLVALITKGYYNIIVCKIDQKEALTDLFKKIEWEFIQP
ncbi:MAG: hypothetical protein WBN17_08420 [Aureibaculum sp.]